MSNSAYGREWRVKNPDYMRGWHKRRLAAMRDDPSSLENQLRIAVLMIKGAKSRARKHNFECTITPEDLVPLPVHCPVFPDIELVYMNRMKSRANSASLDRIDPTKGYVFGNVCIISDRANRIKYNGTLAEMRALVDYMEARTAFPF
jgi:hypothetical protein